MLSVLSKTLLIMDVAVPVVVRKDAKALVRGGASEIVLRKGTRLELPLYDALPLLRKGIVALDSEALPTHQEVNRIAWMEGRDEQSPQPLPKDFYVRVRLALRALESRGEDPKKIESMRSLAIDILDRRLRKILEAVARARALHNRDFAERLTTEERALYALLCRVVRDWYASMIEFLERGDVVG